MGAHIEPFGDRLLLEVIPMDTTTSGGLIMASNKASNKGIVRALGEDVTSNIKLGDKVLFNLNSGVSYSTSSAEFKIVHVKDIIGKIIGEEN